MTGFDLLSPGAHRDRGLADDHALVAAIVAVEVAWAQVLADAGWHSRSQADLVAEVASQFTVDAATLVSQLESTGTPVVPVLAALRAAVAELDPVAATALHRGLTSQDVLDTALMLISSRVCRQVLADLDRMVVALAGLAERHRTDVMTGRSLTQPAVPVTIGLTLARWLDAVLDARDDLATVAQSLPVQCGGAAGTLALTSHDGLDPQSVGPALADKLGLATVDRPWHSRRTPLTRLGDSLVTTVDALGAMATGVTQFSRPELGELREGAAAGRGGSSTMPHKRNPILAVLVRSASLRAPGLAAQLHLAAAQWTDERPDGAWHAQWLPWSDLLRLTLIATSQAAELAEGLEVDPARARERAEEFRDSLLAEAGASSLDDYLGASGLFVDQVLARATAAPASSNGGADG